MKPYPSVEDLLRPVLRVAILRVRRGSGGAHGGGGWRQYVRPFRVYSILEGRSAFRVLDTALRAKFWSGALK